jgi:spore germination protein YaaH
MKTPIIIKFLIIIGAAFLIALSGRWYKVKTWPTNISEKLTFVIDSDKVKNAESNKTYYGTVELTTKREAGNWPIIIETIQRDTIPSEEGGYFGIPN